MTKTKRFIALILGCTMCASLAFGAACGKKDDDDTDPDTTIDNTDGGDTSGDSSASAATTATITYDSNGGSSVSASTVEIGKTVGTLPTPTRSGYNFLGWYYVDGTEEVEFTGIIPVACDMTLKAKWIEQSDFYLDEQSALVVETGEEFDFLMYCYNCSDDIYFTLTKNGTTKTLEDAESAGWITDSYDWGSMSGLYYALFFGQAGDYTITAYSYGQTCTTVVTVIGDTVTATNSTFTASTVSLDKIKYWGTEYANGSSIEYYSHNSVYVYFNAPTTSEVTVTYTSVTDPTDTGVLGATYLDDFEYRYSNGQYYIYIKTDYLNVGYTYTVKLTSLSNGSAEASFTLTEPTRETKFITTPETSENITAGESFSNYHYVYSSTPVSSASYTLKDSTGNDVTTNYSYYTCNVSTDSYADNSNIYIIRYNFYDYGLTAGTYTLTITPLDESGNAISALVNYVAITLTANNYYYWSVVTKDSNGEEDDYYNYFVVGEAKTIKCTADAEFSKVAVCGVYINTTSATTITKYNGTTISAIYSVADGKTTVSLTITAANTDVLFIYLMGSNADGSAQSLSGAYFFEMVSTEQIDYYNSMVSASKYSFETYFADQIAEGGELYSVYTKLQAYTAAYTLASFIEAEALLDEVGNAVDNLTANVYNSGTDYVSSLASALANKTSLCNTVIYYYIDSVYYLGDYILGDYTVSDNDDLFMLGIERYLTIETSDKNICDRIYYEITNTFIYYYGDDIEEYIEERDEEYNGTISALVTAHDSGTEAEYIAAMNAYILTLVVVGL